MKDEFLELVNNNIVITCCWVSELPNWGWFRQKNTPKFLLCSCVKRGQMC